MLISTVFMIYVNLWVIWRRYYKITSLLLDGHVRELFIEVAVISNSLLELLAINHIFHFASHLNLVAPFLKVIIRAVRQSLSWASLVIHIHELHGAWLLITRVLSILVSYTLDSECYVRIYERVTLSEVDLNSSFGFLLFYDKEACYRAFCTSLRRLVRKWYTKPDRWK